MYGQMIFGVCQGILEIKFCCIQVLDSGIDMGSVYEGEYVVQVFVFWFDQLVFGVVEVYYVGGVIVDIYFVFDGVIGYGIMFVGGVVFVWQVFWYDEQGNIFGVFWSVWQMSQNDVNDVFGYVVFIG